MSSQLQLSSRAPRSLDLLFVFFEIIRNVNIKLWQYTPFTTYTRCSMYGPLDVHHFEDTVANMVAHTEATNFFLT